VFVENRWKETTALGHVIAPYKANITADNENPSSGRDADLLNALASVLTGR
jgi:hypothetical protein